MKKKVNFEYFTCLICKRYFSTLWKAEQHVKKHDTENGLLETNSTNQNVTRRRGMLPIEKVSFKECYIPVVKNQIDPKFLEQYETVIPKEEYSSEDTSVFDHRMASDLKEISESTQMTGRPPRKCRTKAEEMIRRVAATLKVPQHKELNSDGDDEEYEFLRNLLGDEDDEQREYKPPNFKVPPRKGENYSRARDSNDKDYLRSQNRNRRKSNSKKRTDQQGIRKNSPIKCRFCPETFSYGILLTQHIWREHPDQGLLCPVPDCKQLFLKYNLLRRHLNLHVIAEENEVEGDSGQSSSTTISCRFCLSPSNSKKELDTHLKKTHLSFLNEFKCTFCNLITSRESGSKMRGYLRHLLVQHQDKLDPNGDKQAHLQKMLLSRRLHKERGTSKCEKCETIFATKGALKRHGLKCSGRLPREQDDNPKFSCPVCKKQFTTPKNMRRHLTLHMEDNPHKCDVCGRKFNSDYNLRRHKLRHDAPEDRIQCPVPTCSNTYTDKHKVIRHLRTFHKPEDMEGRTMNSSNSMKARVSTWVREMSNGIRPRGTAVKLEQAKTKTKSQEEIVSAPCLKTEEGSMESLSNNEIHLIDKIILTTEGEAIHVKGENISPEKCSTLQTQTNSETATPTSAPTVQGKRRPYIYHTGNSFSCSHCPAVFTRAWTLQLHLSSYHKKTILEDVRKPSESVLLMCGTCAYPAKDNEDLKKHVRETHMTKEDKKQRQKLLRFVHKCAKCGRGFDKVAKLKTHVELIHESERNHICNVCKKGFTHEKYLSIHMDKVHTGKKQCPICKGTFRPGVFYSHMKDHELRKTKKFKCNLCMDHFVSKTSLQRHIDCVHLGKPLNKWHKKKGKPRNQDWFTPLLLAQINSKEKGTANNLISNEVIPSPKHSVTDSAHLSPGNDKDGNTVTVEDDGNLAIFGF